MQQLCIQFMLTALLQALNENPNYCPPTIEMYLCKTLNNRVLSMAQHCPPEQSVQSRLEPLTTETPASPRPSISTHSTTQIHHMLFREDASCMAQEPVSCQPVFGQDLSIRHPSATTTQEQSNEHPFHSSSTAVSAARRHSTACHSITN